MSEAESCHSTICPGAELPGNYPFSVNTSGFADPAEDPQARVKQTHVAETRLRQHGFFPLRQHGSRLDTKG
jgi:hypothetical protein